MTLKESRYPMVKKYLLAWFGMMVLAVINGTIRDFTYKPFVGELAAHQLSTLTLLLLFAAYFWWLSNKWPLQSSAQAWMIGIIWFVMTELFEFWLGWRRGMSMKAMLQTYDLLAGQVWLFIPLWVLVGPFVMYTLMQRRVRAAL